MSATIANFEGMAEHLRVLGIECWMGEKQTYTLDEVKKAWRKLCREHHPDKGGDGEMFRRVTHAYECLTNPEYRVKSSGINKRNLNVSIQMPLTFEEVFFGTTVPVNFRVLKLGKDGLPIREEEAELESLSLVVEQGDFRGVNEPRVFAGKGIRCGDERGNAIVVTPVQAHPKFKVAEARRGPWGGAVFVVMSEELIPLNVCLRGGKIDVQTMHGIRKLRVPPGTKPGDQLIVQDVGIKGGDHIVSVKVRYPEKTELKTKAWSFLGIDWGADDVEEKKDKALNSP